MKRIVICLAVFATFIFSGSKAHASKLPDQVWDYVKSEIPSANQRFDSVINVSKDVMYIPLYPAQRENVEKLTVEYSYPKVSSLSQLPEVVIFNNNFVLLKAFKNKKGEFTLTSQKDLPIRVKLGVMPQDMLVPVGLIVPDNLRLVLGDLVIPSRANESIAVASDGVISSMLTLQGYTDGSPDIAFKPLRELKNKKMYVTSSGSKFMLVYDNDSKNPLYELKLTALPSNIVASNATKFALVTYYANKNLEVVDLQNERVVSKIPIEDVAKDAAPDFANNLVYVSVPSANTIYVIDLNSAKLTKTIKLTQSPGKLSVSKDGSALVFVDNITQELCSLELSDEYVVKQIGYAPNASKIIHCDDRIFAISRVKNKIDVYDSFSGSLLTTEKLSRKPVDAVVYDKKVYILCAQDGTMDIYDIKEGKVIKSVKLGGGFYSRITTIPNQQNALLTGIGTGKCLVFDFENMRVVTGQPFEVKVSNIVVVDK